MSIIQSRLIVEKYDFIYSQEFKKELSPWEQLELDLLESTEKNISGYITKTIKSGPILELEIYPRYKKGQAPKWDEIKKKVLGTTPAQERLNRKRTCKNIERVINANFDERGMWITLGFKKDNQPETEKEAKKELTNYIRRVKRAYKGEIEFKSIGFIEKGEQGGKYHFHVLFSFCDEELAKSKWNKEQYPHTDPLRPDSITHLSKLAGYLSKQVGKRKNEAGKVIKSYTYTNNLYKPWEHVTKSDRKITRKKVTEIVKDYVDPRMYFEKVQLGYKFIELTTSQSDFIAGNYLQVKMRRQ